MVSIGISMCKSWTRPRKGYFGKKSWKSEVLEQILKGKIEWPDELRTCKAFKGKLPRRLVFPLAQKLGQSQDACALGMTLNKQRLSAYAVSHFVGAYQ